MGEVRGRKGEVGNDPKIFLNKKENVKAELAKILRL